MREPAHRARDSGRTKPRLHLLRQLLAHQLVGAQQALAHPGLREIAGILQQHPVHAGEVGRRHDAGLVGQFQEALLLDLERDAPGIGAIQAGDGEHLAAHRIDQVIAPFDVLGDAGQSEQPAIVGAAVHAALPQFVNPMRIFSSSAVPRPQAPLRISAAIQIRVSPPAAKGMPFSGNTTSKATRLGNTAPKMSASNQ